MPLNIVCNDRTQLKFLFYHYFETLPVKTLNILLENDSNDTRHQLYIKSHSFLSGNSTDEHLIFIIIKRTRLQFHNYASPHESMKITSKNEIRYNETIKV